MAHVDKSVLLVVTILVNAARQGKYPAAILRLERRDDVVLLSGQGIERLDRGARRIGAAQGAIQKRLVDIVLQGIELRDRKPAHEIIGIKNRRTRQYDDVPGFRGQGDD